MQFEISDLMEELRTVRRGYGVEAGQLRLGPVLKAVCGIAEGDGPRAQREKLVARLNALVKKLPADRRYTAIQTFGLDGSADVRYEQRLARVEDRIDRNMRTVKRRVDDVLQRIAELALDVESPPAPPDSSWHTERLRVRVVLGTAVTEVFEVRRIVSHVPGLAEVSHSVTVDAPPGEVATTKPGELGIDLIDGGVLDEPVLLAANRVGYRIRLPGPLEPGESHEFSYRITQTGPFAPRYVCTPKVQCDLFKLTVRFADRKPERVWVLEDEFPLALNDLLPVRAEIPTDAAGEVTKEFTGLRTGRSYGIGWSWPPE